MRAVPILVSMLLILSLQPVSVAADTSVDNENLTDEEETTRGFVFIVVGTVLGVIGYKSGKRAWNDVGESEEDDRRHYYLFENLVKLSIVLLLLGILLFIGGIFHIL